jgi:ABC-type amino acid transport substrate-binding protein
MVRTFLFLLLYSCTAFCVAAGGLRVGVSADYPPMISKQEGRFSGIEADNAKAVGGILGQELTLVDMPFEKLIPALQAGDIDVIMSGMSITPERAEQVIFTDSFLEVGQMAIMTTANVGKFSQPWSIFRPGVRVGVEPGTTGAEFAARELKEAKVTFLANPAAAFAALRKNAIDLYIHDAPTSWQLATASENGDLISLYAPLTHEKLAWAVRKDDARLATSLNDALRTMQGNGSLQYILNRWIPVTVEVR